MTDAEEYRYGVHLAKCSNSSCACMHIQERLHDGIKTLGVTTVVGDSVYSKAGSRSDEILKYAGQSLFTVIPACRDATVSFQYCFTKAPKSLTGRFVVVMSEPIKIPPFLKDFNCIPLYNVKETNEYTSLITWFDNNVTPSLRVTRRPPVRVVPKPVPDRPSQIVSEYRRPEPLPGEHSVHLSVENESSTYTSDSLSTLGTEGRNKFVSLPSLEILEHPDSGPTARQYCTDIDDCLRTEFKNDLQEGRFHLVFNHCDSAAKKRDGVLYALQTFNKRTLPFPLSYAAQLLRCNQENLRLHGLSYIEYKLLRWDAYLKSGEFEDLMTLEGELFEVLADPGPIGQFNIPQVSHIAGLYMLCLAVIRDHFDRDKTDQHKRFKNFLKERQFQIDEENDRNYYYKALQIILREAFEKGNKGSVASILQFKTTLRDFQRDHTHASLQDLKKVTERTLRQTSMYKFRNREARKMERMLTYQVIVRAVVASLKDKCGTDVNADEIATLWSSPETLRDKRTSTSSDIWMLGQTLYELFMHGSWPYSPRLMTFPYEKVIYWIAYKGIKPFESSGCIPPEICRAILTCLEMEEAERPTATSLLSHFGDMQSEYHNNEVQIPHVNMEQLPYPRLCKFQVDRASKAIKGIPPELSFPDSPDGIEEHFEPDHWETDFIEDDDPEFSNLTVKTVTHESPLYQHTTEEVKTLSGPISGLIRLTAHTRQQEETVMESEWSCPNPVFLSQYVTRAIDRDDSFIDEVIQIFRDVTKTLTELHKNRCIHRDICAKHILVDPQSGQACVYRIARVKQIKRKHGVKVEGFKENWSTHEKFFKRVRWFPVEVLQDAYYSFKGDVYMLAITIWETFNIINRVRQRRSLTLPFSTISKDKLSGHLAKGAILPSPGTCCPNWLYDVMKECWSTSPAARPTMAHVNLCLERREYIPSFEFKRRTDLNKNRKASCFPQGGSMWFDGEDTVPKRPYTVDFTLCREPWVNDPSNRFTNVPRQMCNRVAKTLANIPPVDSIPQANKGDHMYEQLIPYDPTVQLEAESDAAVYDDIPSYHGSSNAMLHYE
ncbi:uncharacterized protein LOC135470523 isoform X2 [Liolophura sinensis]|uniref:uncharacterized protein LOC135470523 isoform X2 n=1 Tax=Liolophura sinensis TaxID=3198878 RepID=UPI003158689A